MSRRSLRWAGSRAKEGWGGRDDAERYAWVVGWALTGNTVAKEEDEGRIWELAVREDGLALVVSETARLVMMVMSGNQAARLREGRYEGEPVPRRVTVLD